MYIVNILYQRSNQIKRFFLKRSNRIMKTFQFVKLEKENGYSIVLPPVK